MKTFPSLITMVSRDLELRPAGCSCGRGYEGRDAGTAVDTRAAPGLRRDRAGDRRYWPRSSPSAGTPSRSSPRPARARAPRCCRRSRGRIPTRSSCRSTRPITSPRRLPGSRRRRCPSTCPRQLRLRRVRVRGPDRHAARAHAARAVHRRDGAFYARHAHKARAVALSRYQAEQAPPGLEVVAVIGNPIVVDDFPFRKRRRARPRESGPTTPASALPRPESPAAPARNEGRTSARRTQTRPLRSREERGPGRGGARRATT